MVTGEVTKSKLLIDNVNVHEHEFSCQSGSYGLKRISCSEI